MPRETKSWSCKTCATSFKVNLMKKRRGSRKLRRSAPMTLHSLRMPTTLQTKKAWASLQQLMRIRIGVRFHDLAIESDHHPGTLPSKTILLINLSKALKGLCLILELSRSQKDPKVLPDSVATILLSQQGPWREESVLASKLPSLSP